MSKYCSICAKPMEREGDICEACQESIRAEAMGRQRKVAKESKKELEKLGIRRGKDAKPPKGSPISKQGGEEEKKPHHFKSMAEYLEHLKEKGR